MTQMHILLDTDIDLDCDDVGAFAVLHALQNQGLTTLLGVICSVPYANCASCVWAINEAYGRGDIPIGLVRIPDWEENPQYEAYRRHRDKCTLSGTKPLYNEVITRGMKAPAPPDIYEDAVRRYRQLLSQAPDGSVTICAIGTLTALAQLIDSLPDDVSDQSGLDLITRKVTSLVSMADAAYPTGRDCFNWLMDLPSAGKVLAKWPTDLIVSGLGLDVQTGSRLMAETPLDHPVNLSYRTFLKSTNANRSSWDQLAVMYSVLGASSLLGEEWDVGLTFDPETGKHEWGTKKAGARRGYLRALVEDPVLARHVEDLMIESIVNR